MSTSVHTYFGAIFNFLQESSGKRCGLAHRHVRPHDPQKQVARISEPPRELMQMAVGHHGPMVWIGEELKGAQAWRTWCSSSSKVHNRVADAEEFTQSWVCIPANLNIVSFGSVVHTKLGRSLRRILLIPGTQSICVSRVPSCRKLSSVLSQI